MPLFHLDPASVAVKLRAESKSEILSLVAERLARLHGLDPVLVLERLEEREKLGSTGFGYGVAIPHARLPGLKKPLVVCLQLAEAVDFGSADHQPVKLVFGLVSPEQGGSMHLQALAHISRMLRNESLRINLCQAEDADALYALLVDVLDRDAAA